MLIGGDLFHLGPVGGYGLTVTPLGHGHYRVDTVFPDSPAQHAGIRAGAHVTLTTDDFGSRESIYFPISAPGSALDLFVDEHVSHRRVVLRSPILAASIPEAVLAGAYQGIRIVFVLVAGLIVLRRADRADARALASFLIGFTFAFARWPWYGLTAAGVLSIVRPIVLGYGLMQAVRFAALFPRPSAHGLRRLILRVNPIATVVALGTLAYAPFTTLVLDAALPTNDVGSLFAPIYLMLALGIAFAVGARAASVDDRVRLRWIALSTGIGVGSLIIVLLMESLRLPEAAQAPFVFAMAAIPIGTAYAILRHRMLDIGFVVNRALVFGIVSAMVVALFTLTEFVIGKYVAAFGHVQSLALEALAALAIGASLRGIHDRADALVDNVFFRERHRAENALRRLARDAMYITEPDILSERLISAVERNTGPSFSALYLHDNHGSFALREASGSHNGACTTVASNDTAIVRARAAGEPVDLDAISAEIGPSSIPGALAFPMIVRGELIGLLACGPKRSAETYAPDERAALAELTRSAGIAFDTLATLALRQAVERAIAEGDVAALRSVQQA